jgi:ER membrane protein complex subunit 3
MDVIHLDPAIRAWVLLPITLAMACVGALRHHLTRYLASAPKAELVALKEAHAVQRAERVRANAGYLTPESFEARRSWACAAETGALRNPSAKTAAPAQMLADPTLMTSMLTKNLSMIVPNMLTAAWVNFFFTGFVVGRVPFPLTQRFRGMLQRGVALKSLDVTYVSSLSWYFLNFFGLGGVFQLMLGNNALNDAQAMQAQFAAGMNADRAFASAREGLEMLKHEHMMYVADGRARNILVALNAGKSDAEARAMAQKRA